MKSVVQLDINAPQDKGLSGHLFGWLGRWRIKRAHRKHMLAFKRFAESQ